MTRFVMFGLGVCAAWLVGFLLVLDEAKRQDRLAMLDLAARVDAAFDEMGV